MKIVIYGLAITSSWGNGHATTYRSLCKALARRGHQIHFVEKDVEWYRNNRDMPKPDFCTVHLYRDWSRSAAGLLQLSKDADAIIIGSYFPDAIAATLALLDHGAGPLLFYDIDTPVTIAGLRKTGKTSYLDPSLIPAYSAYLSFTGGPVLRELESRFGAQCAVPLYCSVDPELYFPVSPSGEFACSLSYLGTYAQDRQPSLMRLFNRAAELLPRARFVIAGAQYPADIEWQPNVDRFVHLPPALHAPFYCSSRFTLNLTRQDMIAAGYSPSVRLFEASACGAAILSDSWDGMEAFLTPGEEVLLPADGEEVAQILRELSDAERLRIGRRARERVLAQHTSQHRAIEFEHIVDACAKRPPVTHREDRPAMGRKNPDGAQRALPMRTSLSPRP